MNLSMTQAVVAFWASLDIENLPPNLYMDEIPEDVSQITPAAYYVHKGEPPGYATGNPASLPGPNRLLGRFDIVIFQSQGVAALEAISIPVRDAFTPGCLTLASPQKAFLHREDYRLSGTKKRDNQVFPVYRCVLSYVCTIGAPTG